MLENALPLPYWFELAAILTGGLSAAMSATRARFDIFGTVAIAMVGGVGGGIIRDVLLLDYGIYAFQNPSLLWACVIAGVLVFYFGKLATYLTPVINLLDNISVALWAITGVSKSLSAGIDFFPATLLGTVTAMGGGILRDVLMDRPVQLFQAGPLYGSAALIGCAIYCFLDYFDFYMKVTPWLCVGLIILIRYGSLIFGWRTKPPKDYSDTVAEVVTKPIHYVAQKTHLQRKPHENTESSKLHRTLHRAYRRVSGQWMEQDDPESKNSPQTDNSPKDNPPEEKRRNGEPGGRFS